MTNPDTLFGVVELEPGRRIDGSVQVNRSYPGLSAAWQTSDLTLHWEYKLATYEAEMKRMESGAFKRDKCSL